MTEIVNCQSKDIYSRKIIENCFIWAVRPEQTGTEGLLEATVELYKVTNVSASLIVEVKTDGEASNIGFEVNPWKFLEDYLWHK